MKIELRNVKYAAFASQETSCFVVPMAMLKRMISLTEPQVAYLKEEGDKLGISVADLIRRIIDQHRAAPKHD